VIWQVVSSKIVLNSQMSKNKLNKK